jgi:hypothetical protein
MAKIQQDNQGIFVVICGWISRPIGPTQYKIGDNIKGKHFRGSSRVGIGNLPGRGKYVEYWKAIEVYKGN